MRDHREWDLAIYMTSGHASRLSEAALLGLLASSSAAWAQTQEAVSFFRQNCANCHTVGGGRLSRPDLKDVTQRKDRAWLVRYLQNPKAVIDGGDLYVQKLLHDAQCVRAESPEATAGGSGSTAT